MTMLASRVETTTYDNEVTKQNGRQGAVVAIGRKISIAPKPVAPKAARVITPSVDTLRTLQARLQAQVDNDEAGSGNSDPGARYLMKSVRSRLNQVNAALARIEAGKYGECTDCDEAIDSHRLVLQPMTTRCTSCQAIAEWRGTAY